MVNFIDKYMGISDLDIQAIVHLLTMLQLPQMVAPIWRTLLINLQVHNPHGAIIVGFRVQEMFSLWFHMPCCTTYDDDNHLPHPLPLSRNHEDEDFENLGLFGHYVHFDYEPTHICLNATMETIYACIIPCEI